MIIVDIIFLGWSLFNGKSDKIKSVFLRDLERL